MSNFILRHMSLKTIKFKSFIDENYKRLIPHYIRNCKELKESTISTYELNEDDSSDIQRLNHLRILDIALCRFGTPTNFILQFIEGSL